MRDTQSDTPPAIADWDPRRYLRKGDAAAIRLSRGFLRSRPEKWFPGFGAQWLPFVHSLGIDVKLLEVRPYQSAPRGFEIGHAGTVDDEPIGIVIDSDSAKVLLEAITPGAFESARSVMLEYMARRLLASLAQSWSGPESSVVRFDSTLNCFDIRESGAIKLAISINGTACTVWLLLGPSLVERLDGLWRRQVRSTSRLGTAPLTVHLEATSLMVPPALLAEYSRPGTVVDLETVLSDQFTLRLNDRPWLPARMFDVNGSLGFEILPGIVSHPPQPEGSVRVTVDFGSMTLEAPLLAEIGQIGAMFETDIPVSNRVELTVNGQKSADAALCTYDGRFAMRVG